MSHEYQQYHGQILGKNTTGETRQILTDDNGILQTQTNIADGDIVSIGEKADLPVTDPTLSASEISLLKGVLKQLQGTGSVVTPVEVSGFGQVDTEPVLDPDQLTANQLGLLRGLLKQLQDGTMQTSIVGSLAKHEKNKVVTGNTDIWTDYTPTTYQKSTLMVMTDTAGVLSLEVDGVIGKLNGGVALDAGNLYAFDILLMAGIPYNLQLSVGATMQINWVGGV